MRIKLGAIDEITLDISGTVTERLDAATDEAAASIEGNGDNGDNGDDDDLVAGPISIAVDVNEPAAEPAAASAST